MMHLAVAPVVQELCLVLDREHEPPRDRQASPQVAGSFRPALSPVAGSLGKACPGA